MNVPKLCYSILLSSPKNLFDEFINKCAEHYEKPAHNLVELRTRENKKIKGDVFEEFCVLYLKHIKKYTNVWLLKDVPDEVLKKVSLKRQDMGIDIIVEHDNNMIAVQCKYKKHENNKKTCVSWTALSTFYALCSTTGPYSKHIVMTNCDYIKHVGKKTEKDLSICIGTFRKITVGEWTLMCNLNTNITIPETPQINQEEIRNKRLAFFNNIVL
jgi:hypothetical protein